MAPRSNTEKENSLYSVHPSMAMVADWIESLQSKTGKSLDAWMKHIRVKGPKDSQARIEWLKSEHGLGTNTAGWLSDRFEGKNVDEEKPEVYLKMAVKYVDDLYSGAKADLRPVHDALIDLALSIADDVKICPCQTMVPVFRNHVIAQVKPASQTRIDFGLALGDTRAKGRLLDTGGFAKKDRITHKIEIEDVKQIDGEVKRWLRTAYGRDAKPRMGGGPKLKA